MSNTPIIITTFAAIVGISIMGRNSEKPASYTPPVATPLVEEAVKAESFTVEGTPGAVRARNAAARQAGE